MSLDYCVGFNYNVQEQMDAQGRFDWAQNDKFPGITQPNPSYHGVVFSEAWATWLTSSSSAPR